MDDKLKEADRLKDRDMDTILLTLINRRRI